MPADADPQQLAMLAINPPTAALLLSEYVDLQPGEWAVQNAANSGVGRWVIAFAKTRGLKTVNIVRCPELVAELEAIGGDVVVVDSPDVPDRIKAAVGRAELRLALDGVSGPATGVLAATLSPRGALVSFAAMSEGPMSISPLDVIFKPLTIRGFWLGHPAIAGKIGPAIVQAAAMIVSASRTESALFWRRLASTTIIRFFKVDVAGGLNCERASADQSRRMHWPKLSVCSPGWNSYLRRLRSSSVNGMRSRRPMLRTGPAR